MITKDTAVLVQGITGKQGRFHTKQMLEYGTRIVAGVTPGKQGEIVEGIPVFSSVKQALAKEPAQWSILFVPAPHLKSAAFEALEADLNIVIITEGVPVHDTLAIIRKAQEKGLRVIGPNCPGIIRVDEAKLGIMPNHIFKKGPVGIVSRSGTLTYEIVSALSEKDIGQSSVIGIGGDPIIGLHFIDVLRYFEEDPQTKAIILIGEIGGELEEQAATYIKEQVTKPVFGFIAGRYAPPGKHMGHAGAIISGSTGTARNKIEALESAGVRVAKTPREIAQNIKQALLSKAS
ncbi:succinate--CoA ligase subunit alpha [Candidatus Woesearchaeota archaeon]|nr:MAG: succinate--CoA ligase subunit alpha [Candidatus Woesearchaeota archaeon]